MSEQYRIVPSEVTVLEIDKLWDEETLHLSQAQRHYEAALTAHASGASSQHLMNLVTIEQNAAILCQNKGMAMMMASLLQMLLPNDECGVQLRFGGGN